MEIVSRCSLFSLSIYLINQRKAHHLVFGFRFAEEEGPMAMNYGL